MIGIHLGKGDYTMDCKVCGASNYDSAQNCATCGAPLTAQNGMPNNNNVVNPYMQGQPGVPAKVPGKGMAIAGMVCGIVSIVLCSYGVILGILGIVFGCIAKSKGYRGGMATAGIVCGAVGLVIFVVLIIAGVAGFAALEELDSYSYYYY